jgi:hypothetical protein
MGNPVQSSCAPDEPAHGPNRLWDAARRCWIEARIIVRDADAGTYAKHAGYEPKSRFDDRQLKLWQERDAA